MQPFRADATILKKKFAHENMKKTFSKVAHGRPKLFFSVNVNRPKSSPNLHFCSIKIAHRVTYVKWLCVCYRMIENIEFDIAIRFKKILMNSRKDIRSTYFTL